MTEEERENVLVALGSHRLSVQFREVHEYLVNVAKLIPSESSNKTDWSSNSFHDDGRLIVSDMVKVKFLGLNATICELSEGAGYKEMIRWFILKHLFKDTISVGMDRDFFMMGILNLDHMLARTIMSHLINGDYFFAMSSIMNYLNMRLEFPPLDKRKGQHTTLANAELVQTDTGYVLVNVSEQCRCCYC